MGTFFAGRTEELERGELFANEPVVVIYGLPGIGKTELAHQITERLLTRPLWNGTALMRFLVDPGMDQLLGYMLARLSGSGDPEPLGPLVELLVQQRHLVLIDDAHHAPTAVAMLVDALGRQREPKSRLVVTSREELPFVTTPVLIRLDPLGRDASAALATHLAMRSSVAIDDLDRIVTRASGSPLFLRHLVAGRQVRDDENPVRATIDSLAPEARDALIRISAISGCSRSRAAAAHLVPESLLRHLASRFLIECGPDRTIVPNAVREILATRDPVIASQAQRVAADLLWEEHEQDRRPLAAVEAICLTSLGDPERALQRLKLASHDITKAGLDHMLLPLLERLGALGHDRAKLMAARTYLRMGQVDAAMRSLTGISTSLERDPRLLVLRATIEERRGNLDLAARDLSRAIEYASSDRLRQLWRSRLAVVQAMLGDDDAAIATLHMEIALDGADLARIAYARAVIHALHQAWDETLVAVAEGRRWAASANARDIDYLLSLMEILAASELGDLDHVRRVRDDVDRMRASAVLRARISDLYVGIAHHALGEIDAAVETLERAYREHHRRRDVLLASLAGHYLGRALLTRGDASAAVEVLDAVAQLARIGKQAHLVGPGQVYLARALLSCGRVAEARSQAEALVESRCPVVAAQAHAVLGFAAAFSGDLDTARRALEIALEVAGNRDLLRQRLATDRAEVECLGGDPDHAEAAANLVLHAPTASDYLRGRALVVIALVQLHRKDFAAAHVALGEADVLASRDGMNQLRARVAMVREVIGSRQPNLLDRVPAEQRSGYLGLLRFLGLVETLVVSSPRGCVHAGSGELAAIVTHHDVLVDVSTSTLLGRSGKRIEGQGMAAMILAALAEADVALTAERLYAAVWGGHEYHPLRHRNTLYVALNRTRKLLQELGETRSVVIRAGSGWMLSSEIDLVVARSTARSDA